MADASTNDSDHHEIRDRDELAQVFRGYEKPRSQWRIGCEAEKFGVNTETGAPLAYEGENGVLRVLRALVDSHGWVPESEAPGGPIISLRREHASITLEPGAQLELSGAPCEDIHAICAEMRGHLAELREISSEMSLLWLGVGFHPLARQEDLPWVPKQRYSIMKRYLPTKGPRAIDMMRRTATVQANFDFSDEKDAMTKLYVSLVLAPLINAMLANSPFREGTLGGMKSLRGDVWLGMDPARSGLLPALWKKDELRYADYVEWALDAGMFLIKRNGKVVENTGQTFRNFLTDGYQGHRATLADWKLHLNTLFPEARIKATFEVRPCDSLPTDLACSVPALYTGLLYDDRALAEAHAFARTFDYEEVTRSRVALVTNGLAANIGKRPARELAERLLEIATGGLQRRSKLTSGGRDETLHLVKLQKLTSAGLSPADVLTEGLEAGDADLRHEILARTRI
jgi:glutamate--cysteine ligase